VPAPALDPFAFGQRVDQWGHAGRQDDGQEKLNQDVAKLHR
jgi:hypothetical protein